MMESCPVIDQIKELEAEEMKAGSQGLLAPRYLTLQCLYLRMRDFSNARTLWNRIPSPTKQEQPHLGAVNDMVILLSQHRYPEFLAALRRSLTCGALPCFTHEHLSAICAYTQDQLVQTIKRAYSCLSVDELSVMLSLPKLEAVALLKDWSLSEDGLYVRAATSEPIKIDDKIEVSSTLTQMVQFMCHLENH